MSEPESSSEDTGTDPGTSIPRGGLRVLALVAALACAFLAAVMIAVMVEIGGLQTCEELAEAGGRGDCFDGSGAARTAILALGWPGGVALAAATLGALGFAATGRRGGLVLAVAAAGILLSAVSILIGSL